MKPQEETRPIARSLGAIARIAVSPRRLRASRHPASAPPAPLVVCGAEWHKLPSPTSTVPGFSARRSACSEPHLLDHFQRGGHGPERGDQRLGRRGGGPQRVVDARRSTVRKVLHQRVRDGGRVVLNSEHAKQLGVVVEPGAGDGVADGRRLTWIRIFRFDHLQCGGYGRRFRERGDQGLGRRVDARHQRVCNSGRVVGKDERAQQLGVVIEQGADNSRCRCRRRRDWRRRLVGRRREQRRVV